MRHTLGNKDTGLRGPAAYASKGSVVAMNQCCTEVANV